MKRYWLTGFLVIQGYWVYGGSYLEEDRPFRIHEPNRVEAFETALHQAILKQDQRLISHLMQGLQKNIQFLNKSVEKINVSVLMIAAKKGHERVVRLLLSIFGLNVLLNEYQLKTAMSLIPLHQKATLLCFFHHLFGDAFLNSVSQTEMVLHTSIVQFYSGIIELLQKKTVTCEQKARLLYMAIASGNGLVTYFLISDSIEFINNRQWNPLLHAAARGHSVVVEGLLMVRDIDLEISSKQGFNALQLAAAGGHDRVVEHLLFKMLDINKPHMYSKANALHYAVANNHVGVARILLTHPEIDIKVVGPFGLTALDWARENDCGELIQLMPVDQNFFDKRENEFCSLCVELVIFEMPEEFILSAI
jgi:ankyrin repeat protein